VELVQHIGEVVEGKPLNVMAGLSFLYNVSKTLLQKVIDMVEVGDIRYKGIGVI